MLGQRRRRWTHIEPTVGITLLLNHKTNTKVVTDSLPIELILIEIITVGLMPAHRLRRWPSVKPALARQFCDPRAPDMLFLALRRVTRDQAVTPPLLCRAKRQ